MIRREIELLWIAGPVDVEPDDLPVSVVAVINVCPAGCPPSPPFLARSTEKQVEILAMARVQRSWVFTYFLAGRDRDDAFRLLVFLLPESSDTRWLSGTVRCVDTDHGSIARSLPTAVLAGDKSARIVFDCVHRFVQVAFHAFNKCTGTIFDRVNQTLGPILQCICCTDDAPFDICNQPAARRSHR